MKKLLIVEDDKLVGNIYRNKFAVEGYQVEVAADGEAGLAAVTTFRPDVIILDLILPKLSGVEVIKQIRALPNGNDVPIIIFSNTYLTSTVQAAWKAGANKCLSKSNCSPKDLVNAVKSALSPAAVPVRAPEITDLQKPLPTAGASSPIEVASTTESDTRFQADLRTTFLEGLPSSLAAIRGLLHGLVKADNDLERLRATQQIYRHVHSLTGNAGFCGMNLFAQMSDAVEALIRELYEHPNNVNTSTLRTAAMAVDFLAALGGHSANLDTREVSSHILVVDDEVISRRAIGFALEKAKLRATYVDTPLAAIKLLEENSFDMVFLDVDMPEMSGFELCTRLRSLPVHRKTPVVFVTGLNDLENRANSMMSGGNDFIGKPFLFIELAVKALVHVLRARLERDKAAGEIASRPGLEAK